MATETIASEVTDQELFRSAMTDEPAPAEQPAPETPAETPSERARDPDTGRFVRQAETAEAAPTQQPPVQETKPEPAPEPTESAGMKQLREAYERAERRAEEARFNHYTLQQQLQQREKELADLRKPKQEPVDYFQDPAGALKQQLDPIQSDFRQAVSDMRLEFSRELAVIRHGEKEVAAMEAAIAQAMQQNHPEMPTLANQMRGSNNPTALAMQWYQRDKLQKETGGDLNAYKARLLEEAMKDPAFQAKVLEAARGQAAGSTQPNARPDIRLPPSINKASGSSGNSGDDGDTSDAGLFRYAMNSRKG